MKRTIKTLVIFCVLTILSIVTYSFIIPTTLNNKSNDKNIFKYKFEIYKIDTLYNDKIEYKKIGGVSEFLNINKLKCLKEKEDEYYARIKEYNDSINKSLNWKKLRCGLFINKNGELGFEDKRALNEGKILETYYLTKFGFNEGPTLASVIDTTTFKELGNTYYKDKNHIYHYYGMAHGGQFYIFEEVDYPTFEILGDCYAKDKNNIYEMRAGKLDSIDYKTFRTVKNCGCFAKDKSGYYKWDSKIDKENYNDEYVKEAIKKLNE